jgi:hypothetical protein
MRGTWRRAWRSFAERAAAMTRLLPMLGFGQPAEPPVEPIERHDPPPSPAPPRSGSADELRDQQHVRNAEERESRHL